MTPVVAPVMSAMVAAMVPFVVLLGLGRLGEGVRGRTGDILGLAHQGRQGEDGQKQGEQQFFHRPMQVAILIQLACHRQFFIRAAEPVPFIGLGAECYTGIIAGRKRIFQGI
jgi:hypothetical protein